jgi:hypothetical protein
MRSGITSKWSAAKGEPSRPNPVMTSSKIRRMPCFVQISRRRLQVALGRDQDAGGARHGLHDHGGHGLGPVQRHDPLQLIGQIAAMLGLTAGEGVLLGQMGVRQMVDTRQQ